MQASYKGHVKAVQLLVEKKADLDIKEKVCVYNEELCFAASSQVCVFFAWIPIILILYNMMDVVYFSSSLTGRLDGPALGCLQRPPRCVKVLVGSRCRYYDQEKCT